MQIDKNNPADRLKVLDYGLSLIRNGKPATASWNATCDKFSLNRATVYRWFKRVEGHPKDQWLELLKSRRKGNTVKADFHPKALQMMMQSATDCGSISNAYRSVKKVANSNGWSFPALSTVRRVLKEQGFAPPSRYKDN